MSRLQRTILDRELGEVLEDISKLYSMADQALGEALQALQSHDVAKAREIVQGDELLNQLRFQIESDCLRILATQQPRAGDLRFTVAAMHIAGELERIGDHVASIAGITERLVEEEATLMVYNVPKMVKHARRMMSRAIQSFMDHDAEAARKITRREEKLDHHYNELLGTVFSQMQDSAYVERSTFLLWIGRHLERIGDRATNIAERVVFMVTGEFIEIG